MKINEYNVPSWGKMAVLLFLISYSSEPADDIISYLEASGEQLRDSSEERRNTEGSAASNPAAAAAAAQMWWKH